MSPKSAMDELYRFSFLFLIGYRPKWAQSTSQFRLGPIMTGGYEPNRVKQQPLLHIYCNKQENLRPSVTDMVEIG